MSTKNYFQMLLTSALWGSSFLLMKYALNELDPFQIAFYRIFIGMTFINILKIEKIKIDVEIAPYIINDFEYDPLKKEIIFHTNFDYSFPLNNNHELTLKTHKGKEYPIVKVRSSIEGLINRSVFYKLIDIGISQNNNNKGKDLMIKSFDSLHRLGKLS